MLVQISRLASVRHACAAIVAATSLSLPESDLVQAFVLGSTPCDTCAAGLAGERLLHSELCLFTPPRPSRPQSDLVHANLCLCTPPLPSRPESDLVHASLRLFTPPRPSRPESELVHTNLCLFTPPRPSRPEGVNKLTCCASKKVSCFSMRHIEREQAEFVHTGCACDVFRCATMRGSIF